MAPNTTTSDLPAEALINNKSKENRDAALQKKEQYKIYANMIFLSYFHLASFYGLYLCFTSAKWATIGLAFLTYLMSILGTTAGSHRLWSHKCYKAKLPLEIMLMIFQSVAYQRTVIHWVKHHRLHHKFSDTDADPHNARRGFFFSHMGWLVSKKSDEVTKAEKFIDMSDMYSNPVLGFQKKYAQLMPMACCFIIPTLIPMYFWGETLTNAWHVNVLRFVLALNVVCCVNSVAHKWGNKPYDKNMLSVQNNSISLFCLGEGFHNYHHAFPWDYQASELGNKRLNFSTAFIDFFAWIGWAYDLKKASDEVVKSRVERTGDGTDLWGYKKCT